ncbi:MAG: SRPBCC family protein [bacterium]
MTEISRSIEIAATLDKVWSYIEPQNWTKIFDFVKKVDGYSKGRPGVGTQAKVVAGNKEVEVCYNVEITEFKECDKIVYKRYGGPLTGKGMIQLKPLQSGTLFVRTGFYDDNLSEQIIKTISVGMEKDNRKIKKNIEHP